MCGRYVVDDATEVEIRRLAEMYEGGALLIRTGDVFPTQKAAVIRRGSTAQMMTWGFTGRDGKSMINARAETALQKRTFAPHIATRRVVIPAAGFYEWDRQRTRYTFTGEKTLWLAGFYRTEPDGEHFIILTTAANDSMRPVHDRMPLILAEEEIRDWLENDAMTAFFLQKKPPMLERTAEAVQLTL